MTTYWLVTSETSIPYWTTVGIEAVMVMYSTVTSTIMIIYGGVAIVEMAYRVMGVDGEIPATRPPVNGTDEIICSQKQVVLPVV
jgi:hypothetical protein